MVRFMLEQTTGRPRLEQTGPEKFRGISNWTTKEANASPHVLLHFWRINQLEPPKGRLILGATSTSVNGSGAEISRKSSPPLLDTKIPVNSLHVSFSESPDRDDLGSDEVLAQLLDRSHMTEWRVLYRLAKADAQLRSRIKRIILTVPLPLPRFWLVTLVSLGEPVDWNVPVPDHFETSAT